MQAMCKGHGQHENFGSLRASMQPCSRPWRTSWSARGARGGQIRAQQQRAMPETMMSKCKCKIRNPKAMFEAMVNQSNCKEQNLWVTGTSARTRP